jgi:hypothetical protein
MYGVLWASMGKMRRTRARYVIQRNADGFVINTKPEVMFDEFSLAYGFIAFRTNDPHIEPYFTKLPIWFDGRGDRWDRFYERGVPRRFDVSFDRGAVVLPYPLFMVPIDGHHHFTTNWRKKDDGMDENLLEHYPDLKICRIDSPLLVTKRYWPDLWKEMSEWLASGERWHRCYH